jgi:hypothetical protein
LEVGDRNQNEATENQRRSFMTCSSPNIFRVIKREKCDETGTDYSWDRTKIHRKFW